MKKKFLSFIFVLLSYHSFAQNVGVGTSTSSATISNFMSDVDPGQYTVRFYASHFHDPTFWPGHVTALFSSVIVLPID